MHDEVTRKTSPPIKVYCLPDERADIQAKADATGLSLSAYLLRLGMGYEVGNIIDAAQVQELARVNGDLGRLGGLLKLWLTNDERLAGMSPAMLRALLAKIEATQDVLRGVAERVVGR